MAIVIKRSDENSISVPSELLEKLRLREGDEVRVVVEGNALRIERIDSFLKLRGALADDLAFDQALELLDQSWRSWASRLSA